MNRYTGTVWLRGACILSAMLIGTSMGGAWQTASAADGAVDESSGQTADQTGVIEAPVDSSHAVLAVDLKNGRSVTHVRSADYIFPNPGAVGILVPLNFASLLHSDPFNTSGKVVVTYTAECGVFAFTSTSTWLDIDIELINHATGALVTVLPPSAGSGDALCTSNGTTALQHRMSSITGVATGLPLADYSVQIRATLRSPPPGTGSYGSLGDTSLVIRK